MVRTPCIDKNGIKRGAWSEEEDHKLRTFVERFGHPNWRQLPKYAGLMRCGKSCRLRWMNYLRPDLKKGNYSREEEELIVKLHKELGNRWSAIAAKLPGRSDNDIKNKWHAHLKKRVRLTNSSTTEDDAGSDMTQPPSASADHAGDSITLRPLSPEFSSINDLSKLISSSNYSILNGLDWMEEDHIFRSMGQHSSINSVEQTLPDSFNYFQTEPSFDHVWSEPSFDNFWTKPFF